MAKKKKVRRLWGDGSVQAITQTIIHGVPKPRDHTGAMPPEGGVQLSKADLAAVAYYVWAISTKTSSEPSRVPWPRRCGQAISIA